MSVKDYRWYKFDGVRTVTFDNAHKNYELEIEKGEVFGIRVVKNKIHILHRDDPTIVFKADPKFVKRVVDKSNGFRGKVGNTKVEPGMQGKDVKQLSKPLGNSSAPKHARVLTQQPMVEDKAITRKLQSVKFPGLKSAKWYLTQPDVDGETPVHFYDVTKTLLNYRRKHGLKVNEEGDWADELGATVEQAIPGTYCEAGTVKENGKLMQVLAITDDL
jgi:hypothetical protein